MKLEILENHGPTIDKCINFAIFRNFFNTYYFQIKIFFFENSNTYLRNVLL